MPEQTKGPKRRPQGYTISAVSERYDVHPQTLRMYEREGLLKPLRSGGNTRYYSDLDLERLEMILTLTRDMGVNLAGVEVILNLREQVARMQQEMTEFLEAVQTELSNHIHSRRGGDGAALMLVPRLTVRRSDSSTAVASSRRDLKKGGDRNP
jgi:MerR family transcriptional regulator/heat shock protein HspR